MDLQERSLMLKERDEMIANVEQTLQELEKLAIEYGVKAIKSTSVGNRFYFF